MSTLTVVTGAPMSDYTTFGTGGPADRVAFPASVEDVAEFMIRESVSYPLGGGSNLLVADAGIRGTVLHMGRSLSNHEILVDGDDVQVTVQAGADMTRLAGKLMKAGVAGFEFAYGVPGTLGGAVVMNAGAHGGCMADVISEITLVTIEGGIETVRNNDLGFGYRTSTLPKGSVVVEVVLRLEKGETSDIQRKMRHGQMERKRTQPLDMPSAGSVFRNPPGDYAGRLIEVADLKGCIVGGAMVSDKHANFIVNTGAASSADIFALLKKVELAVYERFGVSLEREIKLVGEFEE